MTLLTFLRLTEAMNLYQEIIIATEAAPQFQNQFQLFFNGLSDFLCENHTIPRIHSGCNILKNSNFLKDFYFVPLINREQCFLQVFLLCLMFPFSVRQLLNKKDLLLETGPEKSFTKRCLSKASKVTKFAPEAAPVLLG